MRNYSDYLRWLYRTGRPNWLARVQNRASAWLFALGIAPHRVAALGIVGRRSGRLIWFPIVLTEVDGERYVVSMLGPDVNWVRNLAAAHGRAVLRHGRREDIHLTQVQPAHRPPILRRYVQIAPGARPHIPVRRDAPLADWERIAADYPVFRIAR
ncbi:nitroreductase family deazaflavin-dependent oxidoreductase [Nocardia otitidiscaviarum]|uniref:nitroreductase family deazaflavin-dependent oxidoreductase n=1 Tax=Nocardia otitidiscaviarum TaxID=1823 RepID=UPI001892E675|nr:nitroreductase family deazaflavin-dependent oxidoreductase [Nocardia otitidiscaviarum]MBF6237516.1 nitroreductase family deazaflavin-dependent oxidoreductase [Nocardia otitidiscaviarum]